MPVLQRTHHELLVRELIKNGGNKAEAYRTVAKRFPGKPLKNKYSPAVCACRILSYPEVKARYRELQEQMAKRADITIDKILTDYQLALNLAKSQEKPADIVNAATAQAKLVGLLRDRVEHGEVGDFGDMENIQEILEAVASEKGVDAAIALAASFGVPYEAKRISELPSDDTDVLEADLDDIKPASDAVN